MSATEGWERLATAIEAAAESAVQLPVSRTIGAGYAVQNDMVVGISVSDWEAIVAALNAMNGHREIT